MKNHSAADLPLSPRLDRLARLWGRLLTNESSFNPSLMNDIFVELVTTPQQFDAVAKLREKKYRVGLADALEFQDTASNSQLLACHHADGRLIGSIRVSLDLNGVSHLKIYEVCEVPALWAKTANGSRSRLAEGMRLCIDGRNRQEQLCAKLALWRAVYFHCLANDVDWLLSVARPPLNADYLLISYQRHTPEPFWITPPDKPVPHELMALNLHDEKIACRTPQHWLNRVFYGEAAQGNR